MQIRIANLEKLKPGSLNPNPGKKTSDMQERIANLE